MQPVFYTNHSTDRIESNHQIHSNQTSRNFQSIRRTIKPSGNELWDGIINDCLYKPSFSCFQKNIYTYLDNTLKLSDVNVTDRILFKKIDIDPNLLAQLKNNTEEERDNEISEEETREFKSGMNLNLMWKFVYNGISLTLIYFAESPIEEVTDALYGKWRNFMMTHNLELKMPEMLFDGATFRITPRAFEGDGALVKFEMIPKALQETESGPQGRLFGLKKHISKFLKSKCTIPVPISSW